MESTTSTEPARPRTEFPTTAEVELLAYGLPGTSFEVIHAVAVGLLVISIGLSVGVLVSLRPGRTFFSWRIGDRIVVYMAVCDLTYSIPVIMDHSYMLAIRGHVPGVPCVVFAYFLNEAIFSQSLVVVFAALNAFAMVVTRKKLETGRYDWRLLVTAYGGPAILGLVGVGTGALGPSEAWCYVDVRKPYGLLLNTIVTSVMLVTVLFMAVCYLGIWLKIRQTVRLQGGNQKYHRTARVMMVFVAAYMIQWWAAVWYGMWGLFAKPPLAVILSTLVFATQGGLWNFVAYTLIRRKSMNVETDGTTQG